MSDRLAIVGFGYAGAAIAAAVLEAGLAVTATTRDPAAKRTPEGVELVGFDEAGWAIREATHLLVTAPPGEAGDPVLARYRSAIGTSDRLRWIGYCSTTGVYGDRQGGAVDEDDAVSPGSERTRRRASAEQDWMSFGDRLAVDIIRLAGIYGPGRSAFDDLRAGTARRIDRPGHRFSRIHVADIGFGVMAAMATATGGVRAFNFADDEPAPSADVIAFAAALLGVEPPPLVSFA
ncbi:MAG TPA: SDR family NAD(P)-dependent oxidoreductase, partial [Acidiphilium sp.]